MIYTTHLTLCYRLRRDEQQGRSRDALLAKLAARKRMKEELNKEQAVSSEVDRITQAQVGERRILDPFPGFHFSNKSSKVGKCLGNNFAEIRVATQVLYLLSHV